jgi:DNA mismatch repair protein MutL
VNVHPAKTRVRLTRLPEIEEQVYHKIRRALGAGRPVRLPDRVRETPGQGCRQGGRAAEKWQPVLWTTKTPVREGLPVGEAATEEGLPGPPGFPNLRCLGQIDLTYIVAQGEEGMCLIDQHAAHERILYEEYMNQAAGFTITEQLLFPITLQLTHQEAQVLNDSINNLVNLGFLIEHSGGDSFILRGAPGGLKKGSEEEIFLDLLDYFTRNRYTITSENLREQFLITAACRTAIKAGDRLELPEMAFLLEQLAGVKQPYTCPHGRPTMIVFSNRDLAKKFKRIL